MSELERIAGALERIGDLLLGLSVTQQLEEPDGDGMVWCPNCGHEVPDDECAVGFDGELRHCACGCVTQPAPRQKVL